jgi:hypothetical protein
MTADLAKVSVSLRPLIMLHLEYLVEVFPKNIPQIRPLQTDAVHVVVRDLDQLLQTEQSWLL